MTPLEILAILDGAAKLIAIADKLISAGRERGEWTGEDEDKFAAKRAEVMAQAHWQITDP